MKKSAIALVICVALSSAPQLKASFEPICILPLYAFYLLNSVYMNEPVSNPVFTGSFKKLFKCNILSKEWWKNAHQLHFEWMAGQCYKERLVKVNKDLELKVSRRKCLPYGFTGIGLSYLGCFDKSRKALKDVAFLCFAIATIKSGSYNKVMKKYFNWSDEFESSPDHLQCIAKELAKYNTNHPAP